MNGNDSIPGELVQIRRRIDEIDRGIIERLSERFKLTREIGLLKARCAIGAQDVEREEQKLVALCAQGEAGQLDPALVRELFRRIMREAVSNHERIKAEL